MRRGLLVMLTFMLLCSHRPATAEQVIHPGYIISNDDVTNDLYPQAEAAWTSSTLSVPSENDSYMKFLLCVKSPSSSCISECCDSFNFKALPLTKCILWSIAERMNKQAFTDLQKYCGFKAPCPHNQEIDQQEVIEISKAIDNKISSKQQVATCCAKDKDKIKNCMLNTSSIDQCCPTFDIMLGHNCGCYNYAEELDNQVRITLESYCDVTNPCKTAQVM